jgi:hypothetical protein
LLLIIKTIPREINKIILNTSYTIHINLIKEEDGGGRLISKFKL